MIPIHPVHGPLQIATACLTLGLVGCGSGDFAAVRQTGAGPDLQQSIRPELCGADRISLAPSGRHAAAWRRSVDLPGHLVLVDLTRCGPGHPCAASAWHAPQPLAVSHWFDDDTLAVDAGRRTVRLVPGRGPAGAASESGVQINGALTPGSTETPQPPGERRYNAQYRFADRNGLVGELRRTNAGMIRRSDGAFLIPGVDVHNAALPDLRLVRTTGNDVVAVARGFGLDLSSGRLLEVEPWSRPVVHAATGRLIGFVTEDLRSPEAGLSSALDRIGDLAGPSAELVDIASNSETTALLVRTPEETRLIAVSAQGEPVLASRCLSQTRSVRPLQTGAPVALGPLEDRVMVRPHGPDRGREGLVVLFHGGPGATLADGAAGAAISRYVQRGYRVLAIDGSGSIASGPGNITRLRRAGPRALDAEAALVAAYVAGERRGDEPVLVHGESFGAAGALALTRRLDGSRLILVAPWLKYRPAEEWVAQALTPLDAAAQSRWEAGMLGPTTRTGWNDWLTAKHQDLPEGRALLLFAETDARSRPADWAGRAQALEVVAGTLHATLPISPEAWRRIDAFLPTASSATPPEPRR